MNIDDAGGSSIQKNNSHYILSGTITEESDYKYVKNEIFQYKLEYFKDDYIDGEIHVYELYKSKPPFSKLGLDEKYRLDALYEKISELPITIISVAIDKPLFPKTFPNWDLFNCA